MNIRNATLTRNRPRRGLTLLELLIVLVILAIITAIALVATEGVVEQARFDATRKQIENLQVAVLGDPAQPAGTQGFIADMGRPPQFIGSDPETMLSELWIPPSDNFLYKKRTPASDSDVTLFAGWRGPYLRLTPERDPANPTLPKIRLRDGWGNAFAPTPNGVQSGGGTEPPYNVVIPTDKPWTVSKGSVTGSIEDSAPLTAGDNVTVKLYYCDLNEATEVKEVSKLATVANGFTFTFDNIPVGTVALRAEQLPRKSSVVYLHIPVGSVTKSIPFDVQ